MEPDLKLRASGALHLNSFAKFKAFLKRAFGSHIGGGTIEAAGKIFPQEILISLGFRSEKSIRQSNWMISLSATKRAKITF